MPLGQKASKTRTAEDDRAMSMKERAKKARREMYLAAKDRMKNDPRNIERKAKMKADRQAANKVAKEKRKTDPEAIARKGKEKEMRHGNAADAGARTHGATKRAADERALRPEYDVADAERNRAKA